MTKKEKFSDPSWWQPRWDRIDNITSSWNAHSRQSEATFWDTLWHVPDELIPFLRERIHVVWKRGAEVGLLLLPSQLVNRYVIILDTKIECQSREVRTAILALKFAEAYLVEHPEISESREELVKGWDIDLGVLDGEHAWGLEY